MNGSIVAQLIIIGILTLINAFFASAEMAMISINKYKIQTMAEQGEAKAILLIKLLDEPSKFLATIQVGITLAGFFSSAFAATGLSVEFAKALDIIHIPYSQQIAMILITIMLSFIMLLFGELFPKRVALQKSESIAMFAIKPIYLISKVARPFIALLSTCTNLLIRLVGVDHTNLDQKISEEEIRSMVKVGQELGVINQTEKQMINSIFEFDDKIAREVMTPRIDVWMVDISKPLEEVLDNLVQVKYSRVPVYKDDKDQILGIIIVKELLLEARNKGFDNINMEQLIRKPYYAPETIVIDHLFIELQKTKQHLALLIDEHGLLTGIVTMEDLIEEVMGNIEDEFDEDEFEVKHIDNKQYIVNGNLPLYDFNEIIHVNLKCDDIDTIGGYLVKQLGCLPVGGERVKLNEAGISFEILEVNNKRIVKIKVDKV